jgi:hypothetical protein
MNLILFALWLWLTVLGALVGMAGSVLTWPGRLLELIGSLIVGFAERLE